MDKHEVIQHIVITIVINRDICLYVLAALISFYKFQSSCPSKPYLR